MPCAGSGTALQPDDSFSHAPIHPWLAALAMICLRRFIVTLRRRGSTSLTLTLVVLAYLAIQSPSHQSRLRLPFILRPSPSLEKSVEDPLLRRDRLGEITLNVLVAAGDAGTHVIPALSAAVYGSSPSANLPKLRPTSPKERGHDALRYVVS